MRDLYPEPSSTNDHDKITDVYKYVDENDELLFEVCRTASKKFFQRKREGVNGINGVRRVPYRLPKVIAAVAAEDTIYIPEGEKDVAALERAGATATCNPGGAGKWRDEYSTFLAGANVVIIADRDEPGLAHARAVETSLEQHNCTTRIVQAATGKDAADHLAAGHTLAELVEVPTEDAPVKRLEVITTRAICELPDPPTSDELLGPLVVCGQRIVVGAHTGEGKTTMTGQIVDAIVHGKTFLDWTATGDHRALIIDAEQGLRTIKRQLRAGGLDASDRVDYLRVPDGLALDSDDDEATELEAILAAGGYSLIVADPLYKLHRGDSNDERAAVDLMRRFDAWREQYHFALALPVHCRKPPIGAKFSMHEFFGSTAYLRGAEVVLGLQRIGDGYSRLHFFKDRDGDLPISTHWGLLFDRENGFRRDPSDGQRKPTAKDKVEELLTNSPGLTMDELRSATGNAEKTIREALNDLHAINDGRRPCHYRLPDRPEAAQETFPC